MIFENLIVNQWRQKKIPTSATYFAIYYFCFFYKKLPDAKILDVSCGNLRGRLHRELFTCPGIHRECIELEDQSFVTPKKFMYMGEKARLKDWKNAVRINGVQVR